MFKVYVLVKNEILVHTVTPTIEEQRVHFPNVSTEGKILGMVRFTGFRDCKGTGIYESDIISDWIEVDGEKIQSKQTVFFDEESGKWALDCSANQDRSFFDSLAENLSEFEYEVIGNVLTHSY